MSHRLTLVIHSLDGGGAERTVARMANHWAAEGREVALITLDSTHRDRYAVDSRVRRDALDVMGHSAGWWSALRNNRRRLRRLRDALRDARGDAILSFTDKTNVLTLIASHGFRRRVIVCERTDPQRHAIGRVWSWLRRRYYPQAGAVVAQTEAAAACFAGMLDRPARVIENCVWPDAVSGESRPYAQRPQRIVALGRFAAEKQYELLVEAFARVAPEFPEWSLTIAGSGPGRDGLIALIAARGLVERVELPGWLDDPASLLNDAQVFVLASRYEGFPNALLEAMAHGVTPVCFDRPATRSIVRHQVDGLLTSTSDVTGLAESLADLLRDPARRAQMAARATEVVDRFGVTDYFARWDGLIAEVVARSAGTKG